MIGLTVLAIAAIWFFLGFQLARRLPKWLGIQKPVLSMLLSVVVFTAFMIGPLQDHIVGMIQFQKLCDEKTALQIHPNAVNTKRGRGTTAQSELLAGYYIPIERQIKSITDLDTGEVIANYNYFSTPGGWIGPLVRLGSEYTCAANQMGHVDEKKFTDLAKRVDLTYGEAK